MRFDFQGSSQEFIWLTGWALDPSTCATFGQASGKLTLYSKAANSPTTELLSGTGVATSKHSVSLTWQRDPNPVIGYNVYRGIKVADLSSSLNPSGLDQPVTFTAAITPQYGGQASGTVTFKNGAATLGRAALSVNVASLTTSALAKGTHSITGIYSGDSNFTGGTAPVLSQVVQGPVVTLSPTSLAFPDQVVFTTSKAQTVTLTNTGLATLSVKKISVSGPFSQTNTCGANVAVGASCTFTVMFKPKTIGLLTGSISVTDDADGSPQKIALTGIGTYVQLNPTSLNFGNQPVCTRSLPRKITLGNKGSVAVRITSISVTGTNAQDFAQTNTCGRSVKPGASCSITVASCPRPRASEPRVFRSTTTEAAVRKK